MRHRKYTFKIGRTSAHRRSLLANAVCSLFASGRITTTVPKAKEIRRLAERMITLGKKGSLHARRQAIARLGQPSVVAELFSEIAPRFEQRQGGYTRIIRTGKRLGDAADMCILELVQEVGGTPLDSEPSGDVDAANVADAGGDDAEADTKVS